MKRAERSKILGLNWRLLQIQRAPCSRKRRMNVPKYKERRERAVWYLTYWDWKKRQILRASRQLKTKLLCGEWGIVYFCTPDRFDFSVRFENTASRHAGSRQLCLLACVVAFWSAHTCVAALCKADYALLWCVCGRCSTTTSSHILRSTIVLDYKSPQKQKFGKRRLFFK